MNDPMAEIGIKLTDGWTARSVTGGVLFSGRRTVLVASVERQPWEWATVLRHHRIRFEGYSTVPEPRATTAVRA